jgi:hypothetical protein
MSNLPSGEGHKRPFRRSKCRVERCHKNLEEHGDALSTHTHIHPKFILRTEVQEFRGELKGSGEGIYRNAEMEMQLRPNGGGTSRGIEDGESYCDWHSYISWEK